MATVPHISDIFPSLATGPFVALCQRQHRSQLRAAADGCGVEKAATAAVELCFFLDGKLTRK